MKLNEIYHDKDTLVLTKNDLNIKLNQLTEYLSKEADGTLTPKGIQLTKFLQILSNEPKLKDTILMMGNRNDVEGIITFPENLPDRSVFYLNLLTTTATKTGLNSAGRPDISNTSNVWLNNMWLTNPKSGGARRSRKNSRNRKSKRMRRTRSKSRKSRGSKKRSKHRGRSNRRYRK
tara:strand:- start:230 stop:757 length:528 start_codon:yes stop_codon:yes gene_type:complete